MNEEFPAMGSCHSRAIAAAQRITLASVPLWIEARWPILPNVVVFLLFMAQAYFAVDALWWTIARHHWSRRARAQRPGERLCFWTRGKILGAGVWYGVALLSLLAPPEVVISALRLPAGMFLGIAIVLLAAAAVLRCRRGADLDLC